jgi:hypothetical protein
VQRAPRRELLKYKLQRDQELFEKAGSYIKQLLLVADLRLLLIAAERLTVDLVAQNAGDDPV